MTSRRDAVRTLGSIAAFPFLGPLGVDELVEVGRRGHTLAALRQSGGSTAPPRALTPAEYDIVSQAAQRIIPRNATPAAAADAKVSNYFVEEDAPADPLDAIRFSYAHLSGLEF
jgi:hypothetical protein